MPVLLVSVQAVGRIVGSLVSRQNALDMALVIGPEAFHELNELLDLPGGEPSAPGRHLGGRAGAADPLGHAPYQLAVRVVGCMACSVEGRPYATLGSFPVASGAVLEEQAPAWTVEGGMWTFWRRRTPGQAEEGHQRKRKAVNKGLFHGRSRLYHRVRNCHLSGRLVLRQVCLSGRQVR